MTLKVKISLYISVFFTILFGIVSVFIIQNFSQFREEEFRERLSEKALTTIRLLIEVKEIDNNLLKIIDKNSINQLYNEKTLVFDSQFRLIYNSLDDTKITWTVNDLKYLKKYKTFFKKEGENEIYGVFYDSNQQDYFALISANDNYGNRKLSYLISLIIGAYLIFMTITWVFTFYLIKNQLNPLDIFHQQISKINDLNIQEGLISKPESNNEIDLIGKEFNFMLGRIKEVYNKQRDFTAHASHELRTPLLRLSAQVENQITIAREEDKAFLGNILTDIGQLTELINSLLLLTKLDTIRDFQQEYSRLDEILYNAIEKVSKYYKDILVDFRIESDFGNEGVLEISANPNLLEIAFVNLLKNAYLYSENRKVKVRFIQKESNIVVQFSNFGQTLDEEEQKKLFQPFVRGKNSIGSRGAGLGLTIVHRILTNLGYHIKYNPKQLTNENIFEITF